MYREPEDPQARALWRRARWSIARQHHPDLGGDPTVYMQQMSEVDERFFPGHDTSTSTTLVDPARLATRAARTVRRTGRRLRRTTRNLRGVLPRRVPGARRYFDL